MIGANSADNVSIGQLHRNVGFERDRLNGDDWARRLSDGSVFAALAPTTWK